MITIVTPNLFILLIFTGFVYYYLDGLLVQILLLAGDIVGSHDSGLHTSGNLSRENTTESIEPSLVRGGHHLGDVHHKGGFSVAVLHTHASKIVMGSLVQELGSDGINVTDLAFSSYFIIKLQIMLNVIFLEGQKNIKFH